MARDDVCTRGFNRSRWGAHVSAAHANVDICEVTSPTAGNDPHSGWPGLELHLEEEFWEGVSNESERCALGERILMRRWRDLRKQAA